MIDALPFLITGISFGLAAGMAPGPLLTLVISQTLRHDKKQGILIAMAPLLTDIPIVLASLYLLFRLEGSNTVLGMISLTGAGFVGFLAYRNIRTKRNHIRAGQTKADSLKKGILTNILSPHPYIFWGTVGAPLTLKAYDTSPASAIAFILGFYLLLVGSKITIALIVDKAGAFMNNTAYVYIIRALGLVLLLFALLFIKEGVNLLTG